MQSMSRAMRKRDRGMRFFRGLSCDWDVELQVEFGNGLFDRLEREA